MAQVTRLSKEQKESKLRFVKDYVQASNAATGSAVDANANVSIKNIATLENELNKDICIQVNRTILDQKIREMFGDETAGVYNRYLKEHIIYTHDESSLKPYCVAINMYPFLQEGLTGLGGESTAPKNLRSFCGSYINLVFAISSQFAGAVATVEFLMYFDYFARKELGDDYMKDLTNEDRSILEDCFSQVVYSVNQPAAARGYQSIFLNISVFDKYYFESMFGDFVFPDLTYPSWDSVNGLQKFFMSWFNKEREKALLTFPVVTAAMLTHNREVKDKEFEDFLAKELSEGNSFFMYQSDSADSLSSCCRLRNDVTAKEFTHSMGAGGVSTGSLNVMTLNMNRIVQQGLSLKEVIENVQKFQVAYRGTMVDLREAGMLPVYDNGFITMDKQYLTLGVNGMVEAAEFLGMEPTNNSEYKEWLIAKLKIFSELNERAKTEYGCMFNTEFVPAEGLGPKFAGWDKADGLQVKRDCYNSYFYCVEDETIDIIDKFELHGEEIISYLDGGSALHLNLREYPSKEGYKKLLNLAANTGCNYFTTNVMVTCCESCGHIDKNTLTECPKCGSVEISHATRIIGYLKKVKSFSEPRQEEADKRTYH